MCVFFVVVFKSPCHSYRAGPSSALNQPVVMNKFQLNTLFLMVYTTHHKAISLVITFCRKKRRQNVMTLSRPVGSGSAADIY